jgi:UDP-glucose 4-epimerase
MPRAAKKRAGSRRGTKKSALRGRRVLITGGLGFIGSNLAHACVKAGAEVTVYDCLDPKSGGNMYNLHSFADDIQIVINDVRNFEAVCASILRQDIVFHCAAYTSHPNSMREPLIDIDVNAKGTINVLEAVRRFNPDARFVYLGTSTQIGPMIAPRITEDHAEFPRDIYSANKSVAEKYTLIYHHAHRLQTTVVRLVNVFGPRSSLATPDTGFINYFIGLGLQKKSITVYGDGRQLRSVLYVDDAVAALLAAAQAKESIAQVYFASHDRQYSVREIADTIGRVVGGQVKYVEWPKARRAIEVGDAVIANDKIKKDLRWQPGYSLEEGLKLTKRYFKPILNHYI